MDVVPEEPCHPQLSGRLAASQCRLQGLTDFRRAAAL